MEATTLPATGNSVEISPDITEATPLLSSATVEHPDKEVDTRPWYRRPSPWHIAVPLFGTLVFAALATVPAQQYLVLYLCAQRYPSQEGQPTDGDLRLSDDVTRPMEGLPDFATCRAIPEVQQLAAHFHMILSLATNIPALFAIPAIGALCDRVGRRPVFCLGVIGLICYFAAFILMAQYGVGIWVLVVAGMIQGILGSYFPTVSMAVFSYLADTTLESARSKVFLRTEATIYVAMTVGPYFGGLLSRILPNGALGVIYVTFAGQVITLLYCIFLLPESLNNTHSSKPKSATAVTEDKSFFPSLRPILRVMTTAPQCSLLSLMFLLAFALGAVGMLFLYASFRFGWDAYDEGIFMLFMSLERVFWMAFVGAWILKKWGTVEPEPKAGKSAEQGTSMASSPEGVSVEDEDDTQSVEAIRKKVGVEVKIIKYGFFLFAVNYAVLSVSNHWIMFYVVSFLNGPGTLAKPTLRSLLSRSTAPEHQGRLFSAINLLDQSAMIISSVVFPMAYSRTIGGSYPGFFLLILSLTFVVAYAVAVRFISVEDVIQAIANVVRKGAKRNTSKEDEVVVIVPEGDPEEEES
ncbi:major facilitator superfamily domain-containing protein [Gaertneriomyces semiglobifer]|nr:major facilitator superfamily domain-containing protein [Gaertneriomyces semiglobifer]